MNNDALTKNALTRWAGESREPFEALLKAFVEIPSVSSDPERKGAIRQMADLAVQTIKDSGGEAAILETAGNPIVHGAWGRDPALPTVTVYNHLDVQPADREKDGWKSEPFVFTKAEDKYFARGSTDDKGPALTALFGIRAAREAEVPVNLRVLWEFEEEIGSPSFEKGISAAATSLATDSVIVSDTVWIARGKPVCSAGLRGLQGFRLVLETGESDEHSGTTGGAARNPMGELCKLVSEIYDATTGKIKIPGFYEDVAPLTKKELEWFKASGFSVRGFMADHRFKSIRSKDPLDVMKRIWALPTFEVHGFTGGYTGKGIKTIIPPRGEVKCSFRLVPDQEPERQMRLLENFVRAKNPDVKVEREGRLAPYRAVTEGPLVEAVKKSVKFAFGKTPVFVREGGSIGAVLTMEKVLKAPIAFLGLSLPEHGYHAPNENYDWEQASGGMVAFAKYFAEVAALGKAGLKAPAAAKGAKKPARRAKK